MKIPLDVWTEYTSIPLAREEVRKVSVKAIHRANNEIALVGFSYPFKLDPPIEYPDHIKEAFKYAMALRKHLLDKFYEITGFDRNQVLRQGGAVTSVKYRRTGAAFKVLRKLI